MVALVDDEDFEDLNQYKWHAAKFGNNFYAMRNIRIDGKRTSIKMHREIMGRKNIDHIDHDGLNNQRSNLRVCTHQENHMNRRANINATSAYKGVSFKKQTGRWIAKIHINDKQINIGSFADEVDAARAYNKKAIELFCEFANLNVI